jgi:hypothetical protein
MLIEASRRFPQPLSKYRARTSMHTTADFFDVLSSSLFSHNAVGRYMPLAAAEASLNVADINLQSS